MCVFCLLFYPVLFVFTHPEFVQTIYGVLFSLLLVLLTAAAHIFVCIMYGVVSSISTFGAQILEQLFLYFLLLVFLLYFSLSLQEDWFISLCLSISIIFLILKKKSQSSSQKVKSQEKKK